MSIAPTTSLRARDLQQPQSLRESIEQLANGWRDARSEVHVSPIQDDQSKSAEAVARLLAADVDQHLPALQHHQYVKLQKRLYEAAGAIVRSSQGEPALREGLERITFAAFAMNLDP